MRQEQKVATAAMSGKLDMTTVSLYVYVCCLDSYSSLKAPCEYTVTVFMYYLLLAFEYFSVYMR